MAKKNTKRLIFRPNCGIMRPVVADRAAPKTGGDTNNAHPKRIARKACLHKFNPGLSAGDPHTLTLPHPNYAKRTQFQHTNLSRRTLFLRNEPNSRAPSVPLPPVSSKRTQFPAPRCLFYFFLSPFASLAASSPRRPISAAADLWKTRKYETNPICPPNIHSTIYTMQSHGPILINGKEHYQRGKLPL